jgi:hypothetical protein
MTSRRFDCSVCGQEAGTIEIDGTEVRRGPWPGAITWPDSPLTEPLRVALEAGDVAGVYALDPELAPFWCPECAVVYCSAHWQSWDVFEDEPGLGLWHDSIRGRCPRGHERMLED